MPQQSKLIVEKLRDSCIHSTKIKTTPTSEQNHQVHYQEDGSDPGLGGRCGLGPDIVEPVAVLALPELSFNRNSLQCILFSHFLFQFDLRCILGGVFHWSPQWLAAKPDAFALQILPTLSGAVNPVGKHNLGRITISGRVAFNLISKILTLVESIPTEVVNHGDAINQTDADLGAKLRPAFRFPADNRPDMRLVDADNPVIAAA